MVTSNKDRLRSYRGRCRHDGIVHELECESSSLRQVSGVVEGQAVAVANPWSTRSNVTAKLQLFLRSMSRS